LENILPPERGDGKKGRGMRVFDTLIDARNYVKLNKELFRQLYIFQDKTAKQVAALTGIEFNDLFKRALALEMGAKGYGMGGARPNSGNKKGVKFCPKCRKIQSNCTCIQS
jgi:hypothetical protein